MGEGLPLAVGEERSITIDGIAFGGEGVGRAEGVAVFVPGVCPGETVRVRITELRKTFARGALEAIEQPGPDRVAPACATADACGCCQLSHLAYPAQLRAKQQMVADTLARVGHLPDVPVAEPLPAPRPTGYRNSATLHAFRADDGGTALGFHGHDPRQMVAAPTCVIFQDELNALITAVADWLRDTGWPVYDADSGEGLVREIGLRRNRDSGEATMLLVTGRRDIVDKEPQLRRLRRERPELVGVRHLAKTRASQRSRGRNVGSLIGRPLHVPLLGLSLRVSPESFYQVNDDLAAPLVEFVRDQLNLDDTHHVLDLYGGVGTFALPLAGQVARVTLVELDGTAAWDARKNAEHNELGNVDVVRAQVEQALSGLLRAGDVDRLVIDPPRAGCSDTVLRVLGEWGPRRMVYVSCDPATLARDLRRLTELGYTTLDVQPVDMFPQTYHIEAVATLQRR